jgi:LysR family carnitine catabolism transcriptional activator
MDITIRQMRAFAKIAQRGNFTRAAVDLNVSQSALTVQVQALEEQLGVKLFDRSPKSVRLTSAGAALVPKVEKILSETHALMQATRDLAELKRGAVSVAVLPSIASSLVASAAGKLRLRHPGIDVQIHDAAAQAVIDLVKRGDVDFGITSLEKRDRELVVEPLASDRLCAFFRLAEDAVCPKSITLRELNDTPLILPPRNSSVRRLFEKAVAKESITVVPAYEIVYNSTALALAREGLGVAILPASVADAWTEKMIGVATIVPAIDRHIVLVHLVGRSLSEAAAVFIEILKASDRG